LLLPFQGDFFDVIFTQGVALGLVLLPFQGDFFDAIFTQGDALGLVLLPFQGDFLDAIFTQGVALGLVLLGFQPDLWHPPSFLFPLQAILSVFSSQIFYSFTVLFKR